MELLRQYFMEEKFSFHVCFLCFSGGCGLCAWTCRFVSTFMLFIHILHAKLMFYDCCSRYAIRASYHLCGWCSASPELWWDQNHNLWIGLVRLCFHPLLALLSRVKWSDQRADITVRGRGQRGLQWRKKSRDLQRNLLWCGSCWYRQEKVHTFTHSLLWTGNTLV